MTDYFVILSAANERQLKAVRRGIEEELSRKKVKPFSVEGDIAAEWILLDYGDVVVHIFSPETRDYYQLERLWADAPRLEWQKKSAERRTP